MAEILVVNAGSSSLKLALFDAGLKPVLNASVSEIGGASRLRAGGAARPCPAPDHEAALAAMLREFERRGHGLGRQGSGGLAAAGHRVVHGGRRLTAPCRIDAESLAQIEACVPLAPLHNPPSLAAIRALARIAPDLPQTASFDTAFHAGNPEEALRYALPEALDEAGIRRYGFHGLSYAGLVARLPELSGRPLPGRLLALHLGNGASLCAIRDGRSVATTMGYSPLGGLTMGTRAGEIDGNAVLRLARERGIDEAARLLNQESGLLGLGGHSDMEALRRAGTGQADFAIRHFRYWAVRHAGAMIAAMGGLDALAFTGGIGENDAETRGEIAAGLGWLGVRIDASANEAGAAALHPAGAGIPVWIVPADEERVIAGDTVALLGL